MGPPLKSIDPANKQRIVLEAYAKIIPCRKIMVETLSKNGKLLSSQQSEICDDPILLNISCQEIFSDNVEDFSIIHNQDLILDNLFNIGGVPSQHITGKITINIKCPYVEHSNQAQISCDADFQNDFQLKTLLKTVIADIDIELSKTSNHLTEAPETIPEDISVQSCQSPKSVHSAAEICNEHILASSHQTQSSETKNDNNSNQQQTEVNTKFTKSCIVSPVDSTTVSENETVRRRSSRIVSSVKYKLALQTLRPKSSKKLSAFKEELITASKPNKSLKVNSKSDRITTVKNETQDFLSDNTNKAKTNTDNNETAGSNSNGERISAENPIYEENNGNSDPQQPEIGSIVTDDINSTATSTDSDNNKITCTTTDKNVEVTMKNQDSDFHSSSPSTRKKIRNQLSTLNVQQKQVNDSDREALNCDNPEINSNSNNDCKDADDDKTNMDAIYSDNNNDGSDGENYNCSDGEYSINDAGNSKVNALHTFKSLDRKCKICSITVAFGGLTKHMRSKHKNMLPKQKFQCPNCSKKFVSETQFEIHKNSHTDETVEGKFKCPQCEKCYANRSALFKHRKTGPCITPFSCSMCATCFTTKRSLERHNIQVHSDASLAKYKCCLCNRPFVTCGGLRRHLKQNNCKTDMFCLICKKSFLKFGSFKTHMLKHNEFEAKTYQCDLCGNFLGSYQSLKKHVSRHTDTRNHTCTICEKKFLDPCGLKTHMRCHNNEKPFICELCSQQFSQSGHLLRHKLQAHNIGKYPFVCTTCGKGFVDRRNIEMHTKMHEKRAKREEDKLRGVRRNYKSTKLSEIKTESETISDSNVIQIDGGYDISELLGAHVTQTNYDGSQTIISSSTNLQSIEQLLQAASEGNVEYVTEEGPVEYVTEELAAGDDYCGQTQAYINVENIKVENTVVDSENIVYTIENDGGSLEAIAASDLGLLAETAQQFKNTEDVTYYIIKKE